MLEGKFLHSEKVRQRGKESPTVSPVMMTVHRLRHTDSEL